MNVGISIYNRVSNIKYLQRLCGNTQKTDNPSAYMLGLIIIYLHVGCLATAGALTVGLASFTRGSSISSGNMMKFRVLAQGGTVAGLVGGIALAARTTNNKK